MLRGQFPSMFFGLSRCVLFGFMFLISSCSARPLSELGAVEGCRIYNFDDGRKLALKEKNVLHLGTTMGATKIRLFQVSLRVPDKLVSDVDEIAVYPITESPKIGCMAGNACRLAIKDIFMEARFSKIGDVPDEVVLKAVKMYLQNSICE